jgi:uncharacterized membrane protein YkoI
MKIILTTTFLVAVLAVGLFGMNNAFAQQGDQEMVEENETGLVNSTGEIMNATLAFAQMDQDTDGGMMENDTMSMDNDTGMMMGMDDKGMDDKGMEMMKLNGTIEVESTIAEAFKSKVTTDIIGAIQAAQASVGANSVVKKAEMTHAHGYLVYEIKAVDENMKTYKVIVDPGNGQVLMQKEVTWYDEYKDKHKKMKYGDEEKHDKYDKYGGGDHEYDDKKKMMMKDKKY